jgi:SAM-dependent methyltransferase
MRVADAAEPRTPSLACPRCRAAIWMGEGRASCPDCRAEYPLERGVLHLVDGRAGAPGFDPHYFPALGAVEERHFWFAARRRVILDAMRRHVPDLEGRALFDIGCGSGGLLAYLGANGVRLGGACDAYLESLEMVRRKVTAPLVLVDEGRLPPLGPGQSLLGLFDVLEHIDDDVATLRFLASVLDPGGALVITVPAHPSLFDEMDLLAHHRRRYRLAELRGKLGRAGFEIRTLFHFMAPLVPLLLLGRALGRLSGGGNAGAAGRRATELSIIPGLNGALAGVLAAERWGLARSWSFPFGSSILAVALRPSPGSGRGDPHTDPRGRGGATPSASQASL